MEKKAGKRFKQILDKFAPAEWKKLRKLTISDGKKLQENEETEDYGTYIVGYTIEKIVGGYLFTSRTVEDCQEKMNSSAKFSEYSYVDGIVNCFSSGVIKDDGSYHAEMFKEMLKEEKIEWDEVG
jgi:hypothetical protein